MAPKQQLHTTSSGYSMAKPCKAIAQQIDEGQKQAAFHIHASMLF
jgi:hypothetical protein